MSIILFKSIDTAYINTNNGATVQNTGVDTIIITFLFKDRNLMKRNADKVLAFIDTDNKIIYDVYKSELSSVTKVYNGYNAKINAQIFKRTKFSEVIDKTFKANEGLNVSKMDNLKYLYLVNDNRNQGETNLLVNLLGDSTITYTFAYKVAGNSVSKTYLGIWDNDTVFLTAQYPSGRNTNKYGASPRMAPEFMTMDDMKKGFTFVQDTKVIAVY